MPSPARNRLATKPDPAVSQQTGRVEQSMLIGQRQPDGNDHAFRLRGNLQKHFASRFLHARRVEGIVSTIAGDA